MSIPTTSAPKVANGIAVVPSPQPRSKTCMWGRYPERPDDCFPGVAHERGNPGKVALLPQRFV